MHGLLSSTLNGRRTIWFALMWRVSTKNRSSKGTFKFKRTKLCLEVVTYNFASIKSSRFNSFSCKNHYPNFSDLLYWKIIISSRISKYESIVLNFLMSDMMNLSSLQRMTAWERRHDYKFLFKRKTYKRLSLWSCLRLSHL